MTGMRAGLAGCATAMLLMTLALNASGQTITHGEWQRGTTLGGFVGGASPRSGAKVAAGAALGWELWPHFTLEGRALWHDAGRRADSFNALLSGRVPLLPARPVVPFVTAGVGVYRATVESTTAAPGFYRRRIPPGVPPFERRIFNDFVVALGAGFDVFLSRHLALRPEATLLLVTTRSHAHAVPVYGVNLAYHFEDHPITPTRRQAE